MENQNVSSSGGMKTTTAAALSYVLGFITGLYFYLTYKDKYVRFHAMQSIITSLAVMVISYVVGFLPGLRNVLSPLISLGSLVLFIILIIKASKGEKFKLPVIGDIAEQKA